MADAVPLHMISLFYREGKIQRMEHSVLFNLPAGMTRCRVFSLVSGFWELTPFPSHQGDQDQQRCFLPDADVASQ